MRLPLALLLVWACQHNHQEPEPTEDDRSDGQPTDEGGSSGSGGPGGGGDPVGGRGGASSLPYHDAAVSPSRDGGRGGEGGGPDAGTTPDPDVPAQRPPNIILVVTDDQGCGDFGFMGNATVKTPVMDRLAAQGTLFTRFHVMPSCSPTRAGLLTGRTHQRTGVIDNLRGNEFMQSSEVTLAETLRAAGYRTGLVGKWHLGETYPNTPSGQGFDEFLGIRGGSAPFFDVDMIKGEQRVPTQGYATDVLTDAAIDFIGRNAAQPFFLMVSYTAPHSPTEAPQKYLDMFAGLPSPTRQVYAMIASLDENLGRVLAKLETTELTPRTLVVLMGDNGPDFGSGMQVSPRYNCNLRGKKQEMYEGGTRVPLVLAQPGTIPVGRRVDLATAHFDVFPTLLDYAGVSAPSGVTLDGRSLRPLVEQKDFPARTVFLSRGNAANVLDRAVAIDGPLKMVNGAELYDLASDPAEARDLASTRGADLARLNEKFRVWWQDVMRERKSPALLEIGHPEQPEVILSPQSASTATGVVFRWLDDLPNVSSPTPIHHFVWMGGWDAPSDRIEWRMRVAAPATYQVSLITRCRTAGAAQNVTVSIGGTTGSGSLSACPGASLAWQEVRLGTVAVSPQDAATLTVTLASAGGDRELRELLLRRL